MENHQKTSFTFEIDNFSEQKDAISSPIFISGGCEWFVKVHPKRYPNKDFVSVYLHVANPESLRPGWKRRANHSFIMLNQSGKELKRTSEACDLFCPEIPAWGYPRVLPLSKLKEEEILENNKLIIKVEVKVVEVVHEGDVTGTEMLDVNGFQVLYTQVSSVSWIFAEHPDITVDFRPKSQLVKTAYMNVLLGLIETLNKPPQSLSVTELSNAHSDLSELTEAGFKLDWLKSKFNEVSMKRKKSDDDGSRVPKVEVEMGLNLDCLKSNLQEVSLERKKSDDTDGSRVQRIEERVKNLELMELDSKLDCLKTKLEEVSLERKKSDDANGFLVQQLEERVKNLELMELDYKLEALKIKLEEVSLERKKSDDANGSVVQQIEECVKIELMELDIKLVCLMSKIEEVSLERMKSDDADRSRVQQLEQCFKNLELMVLDLKVELEKKKTKSCDDGFLLVEVDEFA